MSLLFPELVYDPYNPEVVRPGEKRNGEPASDSSNPAPLDQGALELELVNRAIEAVRSEVEREQKKLSRIGDQEYDPTASAVTKRPKLSAAAPPLEYDPGSYQMSQAGDYNPTPRSNKYTLDCDGRGSSANSMEYVPTAVAKTAIKKRAAPIQAPRSPSPPSSPLSSSRRKYTLDNCKPPTDLEYDPLSNYSSRPGSKSAKGPVEKGGGAAAGAAGVGGRKRLLSLGVGGKQTMEDRYVPTFKKPKQRPGPPVVDSQKYTASFSESDDESSGTEYRPTSINRLQRKKGIGAYGEGGFTKGGETAVSTAKERRDSEVRSAEGPAWSDSEGSDGSGLGSLDLHDRPLAKKTTAKSGLKKAGSDKMEPSRKSGIQKEKGGDGKKTDSSKKPGKEESKSKKHDKTEGSKVKEKNRAKEKSLDKNGNKEAKKVKSDSKKDSKGGKTEKPKGDFGSGQREKVGGGGGHSLKKAKSSDKHGGHTGKIDLTTWHLGQLLLARQSCLSVPGTLCAPTRNASEDGRVKFSTTESRLS